MSAPLFFKGDANDVHELMVAIASEICAAKMTTPRPPVWNLPKKMADLSTELLP
jgi:hypothetical protein